MRILIDTHIFIWSFQEAYRLSSSAISILNDPFNEFFLSLASVWEMQIKLGINKLELSTTLPEAIALQQSVNNLQILSIEPHHIYGSSNLPMHHRDPFDRLLLAQSNSERMPILSADAIFDQYDAQILR